VYNGGIRIMIKVYFESNCHSELRAIFDSEKEYNVCYKQLESLALSERMDLSESVVEGENIDDLIEKKGEINV